MALEISDPQGTAGAVGAAQPGAQAPRTRAWSRLWPVAALCVLGPALAVLVLRLPLINQLDYADAWFYSGYAWVPKHHFAVYDWNYFSVRFPAILSISVFDKAFGAHVGYVLLRWVLAALSGAAIYAGVRRFASAGAAAGAVVLLYLNPFFSRMLLWDYAGFVLIAAGVIGVGLWYFAEDRRWWWTFLAGAFLAAAIFANLLAATAVTVLFFVELVAAARTGRTAVRTLVWRAVLCIGAGIAVFALGYVGYLAIIGHLSPADLIRPTVKFIGDNSQNSSPYQHKVSEWLFHEPRVWAPALLSVAVLVMMGRRALGTGTAARIVQTLALYTAFLWVYRFAITSSVIETWWAFSAIAIFMAPAFGVLLAELGEQRATWRGRTALVVGVAAVACIVVRDVHGPVDDAYRWITSHAGVVVALLGVGLVIALATAARRSTARIAAAVALVLLVEVMAYSPDVLDGRGGTGIFVADGAKEWKAYTAGEQLAKLIRDNEGRGKQVFLWYHGTAGYPNIVWVDLPQYAQTVNQVGVNEPMTKLRPLGVARLIQPIVTYVLVLSPDPKDMVRAPRAMRAAGFGGPILKRGTYADGGLHYELIALQRRPKS